MSGLGRCILPVAAFLALVGTAWAQENVEAGKSPAQLYASDCAICHKSPNGLTKGGGLLGLQSFLREHYTASRESAAAIAQYLRTVDRGPAPPDRKRPPARSTKDEKPKAGEKPGERRGKAENAKSDSAKPGSGKPASAKSSDKKKPAEAKPTNAKPANAKPAEAKPAEAKPVESKPTPAAAPKAAEKPAEKPPEAKPAAAEPPPSKPADSKPPESKPADSASPPADKPAKSD